MRRRVVLTGGASGLVTLKLGLLAGCSGSSSDPLVTNPESPEARYALEEYADNLDGIEYVGPECRIRNADRHDATSIIDRLEETGKSTLRDAMDHAISADFMTGRTEIIQDWRLSETECRILAYAADVQGLGDPVRAISFELVKENFVELRDWGPAETYAGHVFNEQSDGSGGFWIQTLSEPPASTRVMFNDHELETTVHPGLITARVEADTLDDTIESPGLLRVAIVDVATNRYQEVGMFRVMEPIPPAKLVGGGESAVFCQVVNWGPQSAPAGSAFNQQPDGSAGLWVKIGCAPRTAQLYLDDMPLDTKVHTTLVTAHVKQYERLGRGEHKLWIMDSQTREKVLIGTFTSI